MTSPSQLPQTAAQKQNRRKKVRAVMASGLVLGVGAAVTLAAWSDTVWGEGTFGTEGSAFNIDGSFDGGETWSAHVASDGTGDEGPGQMTFAQNSDALIPGETVYQLVGLRETEANLGADIVLTRSGADTSDLSDLVTVAVADAGTGEAAPTCSASSGYGEDVTIGSEADEMLTTDIDGGGVRWVCFSATLDEGAPLEAGGVISDSILWEFAATSQDPSDT